MSAFSRGLGKARWGGLCVAVWFVIAAVSAGAATPPEEGVTLYAGFEGNTTADFAKGNAAALRVGKVEYAKGLKGRALVIDQTVYGCCFSTKENISPREGSIEAYIMPVDWQKDDGLVHAFIGTSLNADRIALYKVDRAECYMYALNRNPFAETYIGLPLNRKWVPGQWHHLVGTWSSSGITLAIDGEFSKTLAFQPGAQPATLGDELCVGFFGGDHFEGKSAVDELRVFNRAMTEEEILERYRLFKEIRENAASAEGQGG